MIVVNKHLKYVFSEFYRTFREEGQGQTLTKLAENKTCDRSLSYKNGPLGVLLSEEYSWRTRQNSARKNRRGNRGPTSPEGQPEVSSWRRALRTIFGKNHFRSISGQ